MADDQASQFISSQRKARGNEASLYWYNTCSVLFLYNIYVYIFIFVFAFCFFFFRSVYLFVFVSALLSMLLD